MSRNIKTIKCLAKHVGKTVRVVADSGESFLATVEKDDKGITLYTTDKKANGDCYWWSAGAEKYGHHCYRTSHILEELKSISLVTSKKYEKTSESIEGYATEYDVKKNVGKFCKLSNGMIGKIVQTDGSPLLLLKESDAHIGWKLDEDSQWREEGWKYGWYMHEHGCETAKIVEFFDKDPTTKEESKKEKSKPILTARDLLKGVGHYCEMYDGSEGFIAKSCYKGNVCVLHNSKGPSQGWSLRGRKDEVEGFPKTLLNKFKKGWHVEGDCAATQVKVTKILDKKYDPKEASKRAKRTTKSKSIILADELKKHVGHYCEMCDGSEGFIAGSSYVGNVCVIHNASGESGCSGWTISEGHNIEEIKGVDREFINRYTYGWHVCDDYEAVGVKVSRILGASEEYKAEDTSKSEEPTTKKTVLDLTVRELLEKLDEIIKC